MTIAYKVTELTGGGAEALDAIDGADLVDGDFAFAMLAGVLRVYMLDEDSAAPEVSPGIIAPDVNPFNKRWIEQIMSSDGLPVGTIVAWIGGYMNYDGFQNVLGNSPSAVNALLNPKGWHVCNGAGLNDPASPIFNGPDRYLPALVNDRFIAGSTAAGNVAGTNTTVHTHNMQHAHPMEHLHTVNDHTLTESEIPAHRHSFDMTYNSALSGSVGLSEGSAGYQSQTSFTGGGLPHNHGNTTVSSIVDTGSSSAEATGGPSATENRPNFLSCIYIIKVK